MKIRLELSEHDIRALVFKWLEQRLGDTPLFKDKVRIEVRSKQDYKVEWEVADFRAVYESS